MCEEILVVNEWLQQALYKFAGSMTLKPETWNGRRMLVAMVNHFQTPSLHFWIVLRHLTLI